MKNKNIPGSRDAMHLEPPFLTHPFAAPHCSVVLAFVVNYQVETHWWWWWVEWMVERPEKNTNKLSGLVGGHGECCDWGRRQWAAWGWRDQINPPKSHQDSLVVVVGVVVEKEGGGAGGLDGGEVALTHQCGVVVVVVADTLMWWQWWK